MSALRENPHATVRICRRSIGVARLAKVAYCVSLLSYVLWLALSISGNFLEFQDTKGYYGISVFAGISGITCYILLFMSTFKNYNKALIVLYFLFEAEQLGTSIGQWILSLIDEIHLQRTYFLVFTIVLAVCVVLKPVFLLIYFKYYRYLSFEEYYGTAVTSIVRMSDVAEDRRHEMFPQIEPENVA